MKIRTAATLLGVLLALTACEKKEQAAVPDTSAMMTQPAPMADTTAAALWTHLETAGYQSWPMFPGKGRLYTGADPHGALLTTYVNQVAMSGLSSPARPLPEGSILVKENYMPDSSLAAVTVMYKRAGYDPAHNDWFWVKRLADGTVEFSGRGGMCADCHGSRASNDYVMTQ